MYCTSMYSPVFRSRDILVGAGVGVKVRLRLTAPAPPYCTVDKTEEILNDILFVPSNIDSWLINKQIIKNKWIFSRKEGEML